ncbi:hypothetical protein AB6N23_14970 [Cellulomonas sp. 179-A 9B4 NHS]|uniref:hypothetical protein n=1 Tax=Cellulomonas sp. 179-A 9B4 NHS TaxID=3142379 RepID=UPI0039A23E40
MPLRLSPLGLLLRGIALLVVAVVLDVLLLDLVTARAASLWGPLDDYLRWAAAAALLRLPTVLQLVGAGLVAGAFVVRALQPAPAGVVPVAGAEAARTDAAPGGTA